MYLKFEIGGSQDLDTYVSIRGPTLVRFTLVRGISVVR